MPTPIVRHATHQPRLLRAGAIVAILVALISCDGEPRSSNVKADRSSKSKTAERPTSNTSDSHLSAPVNSAGISLKGPWGPSDLSKVQNIRGDLSVLRELFEGISFQKSTKSATKNEMIALALRFNAKSVNDRDLIDLIETYAKGDGKSYAYSHVIGALSDTPRLKSFAESMPFSPDRNKAFQRLYLELCTDPQSYRQAINEFKKLSEPEEVTSSLMGLIQGQRELLEKGAMTPIEANRIIDEAALADSIAKQLRPE